MQLKKQILFLCFCYFISLSTNSQQTQTTYKYPRGIAAGEDQTYKDISQKAVLTRDFNIVRKNSFSLKKYAPIPKSQGRYSTCTGWAVAYAARTILEAQKQHWTNKAFITENAFSPTFQYRLALQHQAECRGAFTSEVMESLKTVGSVPFSEFYTLDNKILCPSLPLHKSNFEKAEAYKIETYATLWTDGYADNKQGKVKRTKKSIEQKNPVVISMICPASFDEVGNDGLWRATEDFSSAYADKNNRHALCVVGYDNDKFGGAFEVQNSWGTAWGNKGYAWITYDDFDKFVYQGFQLIQLPKASNESIYLSGSFRLQNLTENETLKAIFTGTKEEQKDKTRNFGIKYETDYKIMQDLKSGTEMRLFLKSEAPAYVYLLGTGSKDTSVKTLFPFDNISPAMNYEKTEIALPSETETYEMDNTTGKDYIIILFSKKMLDIEQIREEIEHHSGSFSSRLKKILGNDLIDNKDVQFLK